VSDVEPIDIGHGVVIELTGWYGHDGVYGLRESHDRPDGAGRCEGGLMFDLPGVREAFPGRDLWTVESWEPLTLSPSLLCSVCGHHGFIRNGTWVPA